jgi:hypothetical protein
MTALPADTPVTTPEAEPTRATAVLLLAHAPPEVASLKTEAEPGQTVVAPAMAAGGDPAVIVAAPAILLEQPVAAIVATALNVPRDVDKPKSRIEPVPLTVITGVTPLYNT